MTQLKRSLVALLTVLGIALTCSSPANAGGLYFGINLEVIGGPQREPFIKGFSITPLPIPGVQIGYDIDDGANAFGARLSLSFVFFGQIALDGYYRLSMNASGDNAYFGGGAEYQVISFSTTTSYYGLHALLGYEWRLGEVLALFLEATPGVVFSGLSGASFGAMLRGGLVLHF
jgi:hypothetical protein